MLCQSSYHRTDCENAETTVRRRDILFADFVACRVEEGHAVESDCGGDGGGKALQRGK